jgi:hypothetical protein
MVVAVIATIITITSQNILFNLVHAETGKVEDIFKVLMTVLELKIPKVM